MKTNEIPNRENTASRARTTIRKPLLLALAFSLGGLGGAIATETLRFSVVNFYAATFASAAEWVATYSVTLLDLAATLAVLGVLTGYAGLLGMKRSGAQRGTARRSPAEEALAVA